MEVDDWIGLDLTVICYDRCHIIVLVGNAIEIALIGSSIRKYILNVMSGSSYLALFCC